LSSWSAVDKEKKGGRGKKNYRTRQGEIQRRNRHINRVTTTGERGGVGCEAKK